MGHLYLFLNDFFQQLNFGKFWSSSISVIICLIAIYLLAFIVFFITKKNNDRFYT